jgi:beta-lactamase superfamily II metal-dependent hydrolase
MVLMKVDIVNVEHGACAFIVPPVGGRLAMVDCGHNESTGWRPSTHLKNVLKRTALDYLFITNADQDHYSDLHDLVATVQIHWFYRSWKFTSEQFLEIKKTSGPLSSDAKSYHSLTKSHIFSSGAVPEFNSGMGGITYRCFANPYGVFDETNDLSMATFFSYGGFQILFPGDLQVSGWTELLKNEEFRKELGKTTILVASHHGREDGFCAEVFDYCNPLAIVMSDKPIEHATQEGMAAIYGAMVLRDGVVVVGSNTQRKVLTTRRDGSISFEVQDGAHFNVRTNVG